MKISLRLYRMHDLDLIMLKSAKGVNFARIVKTVLRSFANNDFYAIDLSYVKNEKEPRELPYRSLQVIKLDDLKDKKVINMLNNIKDGYRNSFIKNIIRLYISTYLLSFYQERDNFMNFPVKHTCVKNLKLKQKKEDNTQKNIVAKESETDVLLKNEKEMKSDSVIKELKKQNTKTEIPVSKSAPVMVSEISAEQESSLQQQDAQEQKLEQENNTEALDFFMSLMQN